MPSPLEQLLSVEELRDMGQAALKKRMLMQMLMQNPVAEDEADITSRDYLGPDGTGRPESKINRYVPGSTDPGAARQGMNPPSPALIATLLQALKGR